MTRLLASAALLLGATTLSAQAEPVPYTIDPAHSQIMFSFDHAGFSTVQGLVFDISGEMMFDEENPSASTVSATIPTSAIVVTPEFEQHLLQSGDFFSPDAGDITFQSTGIEVTGDNTANITGDLTVNGQTQEITLETTMNKKAEGPMGNTVAGFTGTTTLNRENFGLGMLTPVIPAEIPVTVNIEGSPAQN